jgi:hypothetical protein
MPVLARVGQEGVLREAKARAELARLKKLLRQQRAVVQPSGDAGTPDEPSDTGTPGAAGEQGEPGSPGELGGGAPVGEKKRRL